MQTPVEAVRINQELADPLMRSAARLLLLYVTHNRRRGYRPSEDDVDRYIQSIKPDEVHYALVNKELGLLAAAAVRRHDPRFRSTSLLQEVAVEPEFRHDDLGTEIMNNVAADASREGDRFVRAHPEPEGFFSYLGFTADPRHPDLVVVESARLARIQAG